MLDQNITTILSTVIGGILVIAANYFSQRLAHKSEKEKRFYEKIEEIFLIGDQIEYWMRCQLWLVYKHLNMEEHYIFQHTMIDETKLLMEPPISRFKMLIFLYFPNLRQRVLDTKEAASDMSELSHHIQHNTLNLETTLLATHLKKYITDDKSGKKSIMLQIMEGLYKDILNNINFIGYETQKALEA